MSGRLDIDSPPWDQSTFLGRLKYFFWITDSRTIIVPNRKLDEAKQLVDQYRNGSEPPGTTDDQVWYAKKLVLSAFHPDSGERQNVIGRMSCQVPGGMIITGCLLQFYRTNVAVIFWQWVNQSFNALVNYTNRNAKSDITNKQILTAYVSATTCAVITAVGLKRILSLKTKSVLLQRFVPFAAVASANMVNIPLMRQSEVANGIACFDEHDNKVTESRYAACKGISQVVFSRITMAAPGMMLTPVIVQRLEKLALYKKYPSVGVVVQTAICGAFLVFMTPTACALFPQRCSIPTDRLGLLDSKNYEELKSKYGTDIPKQLYFNKGL